MMKISRRKLTPNVIYMCVRQIYNDTNKPATRTLIARRLAVKKTPHLINMINKAIEQELIIPEMWEIFNGRPVWVYFPVVGPRPDGK